jgi:AcrR family transcriptional regulator
MPASPPRPRRAPPDRQRQRVSVDDRLLAAMERLLEQGHSFGALTVEQLTEEAGMARATFYLHFRDKGELVGRLMQRLTTEIVESGGGWFRGGSEVDRRSMHFALHGIIGSFKKHQAIVAAIADTAAFDPKVAKLHEQMVEDLCKVSRRAIAQVRREGRGAPGAPPELADMLTRLIELYCTRFISRYEGRQLTQLVNLFAFICGNTIFAAPAPARTKRSAAE